MLTAVLWGGPENSRISRCNRATMMWKCAILRDGCYSTTACMSSQAERSRSNCKQVHICAVTDRAYSIAGVRRTEDEYEKQIRNKFSADRGRSCVTGGCSESIDSLVANPA